MQVNANCETSVSTSASMIRFDSIALPKMTRTKEGYLRGQAVVSRAGVFQYMNMDGTIRGELRHPDEIFQKSSLDTLKMIPITNDHPPEFLNANNIAKYQVGYTGETYDVVNDQIILTMTITHQDVIDAIEGGKMELSMGYLVNVKLENGEYNGEHYDAKQLSPIYNHLAIVLSGRAGSVARLRLDNARQMVQLPINDTNDTTNLINFNQQKVKMTNTIKETNRIDALNIENHQLTEKLKSLQTKLDSAEEAAKAIKQELTTAQKELEAEKELKADSIIEKKVMDRVDLITKVGPFIGNQMEGILQKNDREIMELAINSIRTDAMDFAGESDDYLRGAFEAAIALSPRQQNMDKDGKVAAVMRQMRTNNDGSNSLGDTGKIPSLLITAGLREKITNSKQR